MTFHARAAAPDDYADFVRFTAQLLPDQPAWSRGRWLAHVCPETLFLAAPSGELVAYGLAFAFGARGDVRQVVVDAAHRGRGAGRAMLAALRAKLVAAGCSEWRLECRADNAPAVALYRSAGMAVLHECQTVRADAAAIARFADTRSGQHAVADVAPADEAALERSLDLGAGQIARWRAIRPHCRLLRVGATALVHVRHDHSPERGLLFPLRAPDADTAAHLVAATAPYRAWEAQTSDLAVTAAMIAAGATLHERLVEMGGPTAPS